MALSMFSLLLLNFTAFHVGFIYFSTLTGAFNARTWTLYAINYLFIISHYAHSFIRISLALISLFISFPLYLFSFVVVTRDSMSNTTFANYLFPLVSGSTVNEPCFFITSPD